MLVAALGLLAQAASAASAAAATSAAAEIDRVVQEGIDAGVYPGAVVVVGRHDTVLHARGYGHFTWSRTSAVPDPDSTLWDLASLTKVVATTPAVMRLVEWGKLDLDRPAGQYLPDFAGEGKDAVTVRHLLAHTSGLRAWLDLPKETGDAAAARRRVVEEPLRWRPGARVEYSDLNAILLGWIVEAASGLALDRFVAEQVYQPLGLEDTGFKPPRSAWRRTVPVGLWRGTAVAGTVHDQNAALLGGVAGHAGLFSTGRDLARYAQALLNARRGANCPRFFRQGMVELFTRRAVGNRALGWELRDTTTADNTGVRLTAAAFGHTGFTGTSMWIDPAQDLFVIVLTNRVFAPRTRRSVTRLREVRARVADAAVGLAERVPAADGGVGGGSEC